MAAEVEFICISNKRSPPLFHYVMNSTLLEWVQVFRCNHQS